MPTTIKIFLGDDLRRFTWQRGPDFHALACHINDTYKLAPETHTLKYLDDEQDLVTLSNSDEFEEALRSAGSSILRLKLTKTKTSPPEYGQQPGVHPGVQCDGCGQHPLMGVRYKSTDMFDFDLCGGCRMKSASHNFIPMQPSTTAQHDKPVAAMGCGMPAALAAIEASLEGRTAPPCSFRFKCKGSGRDSAGKESGSKLSARFVKDITIFDGTQMSANTPFTKIWRLRNEGGTPWPVGTLLIQVGGDDMGATNTRVVCSQAVSPGEEMEVSVDLHAPASQGRYTSFFRLAVPVGFGEFKKFGQRLWCNLQVADLSEPPQVNEAAIDSSNNNSPDSGSSSAAHEAQHDERPAANREEGNKLWAKELMALLSPTHQQHQLLIAIMSCLSEALDSFAAVAACIEEEVQEHKTSLRDALASLHARCEQTHLAVLALLRSGAVPNIEGPLAGVMSTVQQLLHEGIDSPRFERYALELSLRASPMLNFLKPLLQPPLMQMMLPQLLHACASTPPSPWSAGLPMMHPLHELGDVLHPLFSGQDLDSTTAAHASNSATAAAQHEQAKSEKGAESSMEEVALSDMSVKQLKRIIQQAGLHDNDCVEKHELLALARQASNGSARDKSSSSSSTSSTSSTSNSSFEHLSVDDKVDGTDMAATLPSAEIIQDALHLQGSAQTVVLPKQMLESDAENEPLSQLDMEVGGAANCDGQVPNITEQQELLQHDPELQKQQMKEQLQSMGFPEDLLGEVLMKNAGADITACVHDLTLLNEWEPLLDDLEEMGFENRSANRVLLLHNGGNLKKAVHQLVKG